MAAPKHWGYTRGRSVPNEILVSWADGDLTAQVAQEVDETLLGDRQQRRMVAAYARAAADSVGDEITSWHGKRPGKRALHLLRPRQGLLDTIVEEHGHHPGDWMSGEPSGTRTSGSGLSAKTVASAAVALAVAAVVIVWMIRHL